MRINSNIASLQAQRQLSTTTRTLQRALERLSSGRRISRAADDAAGLGIAEGLTAQIRGMRRATLNVNDSIGFLATADGALATQIELTQRMRELALQASNGTLGITERKYLDDELQTLLEEFERLATQTNFNGQTLLDGSFAETQIQVGTNKDEIIGVELESSRANDIFRSEQSAQSFTNSYIEDITGNVYDTAAGDLNGDGYDDIGAVGVSNGNSSIFLNDGNGSFTETNLGSVNGTTVDFVDVNGDDNLDWVSTGQNDTIKVRLGRGDGTFDAVQTSLVGTSTPASQQFKDLNNDGNLDLILRTDTTLVSVYFGDGAGNFTLTHTIEPTSNVTTLRLADFNEDGHDDLLVFRTSGGISDIWTGDGQGNFSFSSTLTVSSGWSGIDVGDINNDGHIDIMGNTGYRFGNGDGTFQTTQNLSGILGGGAQGVSLTDLDKDGNLDFIKSFDHYLAIGFGDGAGNYTQVQSYTFTSSSTGGFALGDFDGDDYLDIARSLGIPNSLRIFTQDLENTSAVSNLDLTTRESAADSLEIISSGIEELLGRRARIGALQSRLDFAASNILIGSENLEAARSRILDADISQETSELVRQQILQQSGVSVLAQANVNLKIALELLKR